MAVVIPFAPSIPFQRFGCALDGNQYFFDARWNKRDGGGAWYFDVYEEGGTAIVQGIKIVLGIFLGRRVNHTLFRSGVIVATDLSAAGREAGLDDLGERVQVARFTTAEVLSMRIVRAFPDPDPTVVSG